MVETDYLIDKVIPYPSLPPLLELISTEHSKPLFINIGGASASGKSTIADKLASTLPDCQIFSMDRYLVGQYKAGQMSHISKDPRGPYFSGINPAAYSIDQILEDVLNLKQGLPIKYPIFDKVTNERAGQEVLEPKDTILVEGLYALEEDFTSLADLSLLIEATLHDRLMRKVIRNHLNYSRADVSGIITEYLLNTEPNFRFYESRLQKVADLIVLNPSYPLLDFRKYFSSQADEDKSSILCKLIPRPSNGSTHSEEMLSLTNISQQGYRFRYSVAEKTIIDAEIAEQAIEALYMYYEFQY